MTLVYVLIALLLFAAGACTLVRIIRGPTVLNRALGNDVLVSIIICVLGVEAAVFQHTTTVPILLSLSLVGFVGSVSIAWFVAKDVDDERDRATDGDADTVGELVVQDDDPEREGGRP
ncbi:monovalent cation/H+ antiporter complex subunit F [Arsenicicoccus piscis]|uniref:monovalent cation/H+ antiporter complex subunit F n=1 Tax=Arsenicicoccus piscis TaxID=673954 RepID=UPI001F4C86A7|nr:monovalent cation/H+ antiporter complex subunit F [Arsenicicoccus piscis]MCH8626229.1 monovalent cation/H+ antiporter complex subunit F [Arsenicicoccus piscis]